MADKKEVNGLASYIFGIMSLVFAFFSPLPGIVFGIIGIAKGKNDKEELAKRGKKLSTIGLVLSIILLIVSLAVSYYLAKTGALNSSFGLA